MPSSLLTLLDDIATVLDDVAVLTKVAAKKTAGVLGDDLALNAQQVAGVERRPRAAGGVGGGQGLVAQQGDPGAGGAGHQRVGAMGGDAAADGRRRLPLLRGLREARAQAAARHSARTRRTQDELAQALADPASTWWRFEKDKIKGAVRTDFILSAEIIVITLGTVASAPFATQVGVLVGIAIAHDGRRVRPGGGHRQARRPRPVPQPARGRAALRAPRALGGASWRGAPWLMKGLSVAGTAAMFLVGGGILVHGIPPLHHAFERIAGRVAGLPGFDDTLRSIALLAFDATTGIAAGALLLAIVTVVRRVLTAGPSTRVPSGPSR